MDDAARLATELGAVLSHESAAHVLGLRVLTAPPKPVLTVARGRSRVVCDSVEIFRAGLPDSDVLVVGDVVLTAALRTVCDLARHRSFEAAVVTLDSAIAHHLILEHHLDIALTRLQKGGRGAARVRRVLLAGDGRSQSVPETLARVWLQADPRIGRVIPQLALGEGGHRYDLGLPELRKVAEYQSWEFHGKRSVWVLDSRWGNAACAAGWGYVQLVDSDLRRGAAHVVDVALGLTTAPKPHP